VQGQICDILRPRLAMNRFLPLLAPQIPTLWIHTSGGGEGGALILDRCRALDLFASVDAHLCSTDSKNSKRTSKRKGVEVIVAVSP
jgi:hypothetical protein